MKKMPKHVVDSIVSKSKGVSSEELGKYQESYEEGTEIHFTLEGLIEATTAMQLLCKQLREAVERDIQ